MRYPGPPSISQNYAVQNICEFTIGRSDIVTSGVEIDGLKNFILGRQQGISVFVEEYFKGKYKVFCVNSSRLHYCPLGEEFYELYPRARAWPHKLTDIRYYNFIPLEEGVDSVKKEVCAHLVGGLLGCDGVIFRRGTRYFYEVSIVKEEASGSVPISRDLL